MVVRDGQMKWPPPPINFPPPAAPKSDKPSENTALVPLTPFRKTANQTLLLTSGN